MIGSALRTCASKVSAPISAASTPVAALLLRSSSARFASSPATHGSSKSKQLPIPDGAKRVIALGDIHGDPEQMQLALREAHIIDENGDWIGGATEFVQTGDMLDRGHDDKAVMDQMMKLQVQAPEHGGSVTVLCGNHELMNIDMDLRYVNGASIDKFGGAKAFRELIGPNGHYGKWLRRLPLVHVTLRTVFVHAFLHPQFVGNRTWQQVNEDYIAMPHKLPSAGSNHNPVWHRLHALQINAGYGSGGTNMSRKVINEEDIDLNTTLELLSADRMVVGHTPQPSAHVAHSKKLVCIDVGMSRWMNGGRPVLLELRGDQDRKDVQASFIRLP